MLFVNVDIDEVISGELSCPAFTVAVVVVKPSIADDGKTVEIGNEGDCWSDDKGEVKGTLWENRDESILIAVLIGIEFKLFTCSVLPSNMNLESDEE